MLVFLPGDMSFEDYFCLEGCDEEEMAIRFLFGLTPGMLQRAHGLTGRTSSAPMRSALA